MIINHLSWHTTYTHTRTHFGRFHSLVPPARRSRLQDSVFRETLINNRLIHCPGRLFPLPLRGRIVARFVFACMSSLYVYYSWSLTPLARLIGTTPIEHRTPLFNIILPSFPPSPASPLESFASTRAGCARRRLALTMQLTIPFHVRDREPRYRRRESINRVSSRSNPTRDPAFRLSYFPFSTSIVD